MQICFSKDWNPGSAGLPGFIYKGEKCALDHLGNLTAFKMTMFATDSLLTTISLEPVGLACVERYPWGYTYNEAEVDSWHLAFRELESDFE